MFVLRSRLVAVLLVILVAAGMAAYLRRASAPPNVLLVTLDTVRADHLGSYGSARAETPTLDRLAREGVRFEYAYSPAPLTLPAHASLMTGLQPLTHGLTDNDMRATAFPAKTLAERLQGEGYDTAGFVAAFVLNSMHGLDRGFQHYDDGPKEAGDIFQMFRGSATASERVDRLLEWLRLPRKKPFFAWLHLYDAHAPYTPPEGYVKRFADRLYDGEIAYVDAQLSRVIGQLERQGSIEDTLIIVTADHGESLGEHGEVTHGIFLYDATLRIPLLLHWPRHLRARVEAAPATLVDVMPTILGLLGLPQQEPRHGIDLFGEASDARPWRFLAYSDYTRRQYGWAPLAAIRQGAMKYIEAPRAETYDTRADPGELNNLYEDDPASTSGRLSSALAIAKADLQAHSLPHGVDGQMSPQQLLQLRSLGYLAGGNAKPTNSAEKVDPKDGLGRLGPLEKAYEALESGDLPKAEKLFNESLASAPEGLSAQTGIARTLELEGRYAEAERWHERILAADPQAVLSLARLVDLRARRADCVAARLAADDLQRQVPQAAAAIHAHWSVCEKTNDSGSTRAH